MQHLRQYKSNILLAIIISILLIALAASPVIAGQEIFGYLKVFGDAAVGVTVRTVSTEADLIAANADTDVTQIILIKPISLTANLTITKQYDRTMGAVITTNGRILTITTSFEGVNDAAFNVNIVPIGVACVLLPNTTTIKVSWFGAKADDLVTSANTNSAALDAAYASISGVRSSVTSQDFARACRIVFEAGNYYLAWGMDLSNYTLSGGWITVAFEGSAWRTTHLTLHNDAAAYLFYESDPTFPDSVTGVGGGRPYEFRNFQIRNDYAGWVDGYSWHPATAFLMTHVSHTLFENIYVYKFTEGFNLFSQTVGTNTYGSAFVTFDHCYVKYCQRGFTMGNSVNQVMFRNCDVYQCGDNTTADNGWGYKLYKCKGASLVDSDAENMNNSPGLMVEASMGVSITGGDWEDSGNSRMIQIKGDTTPGVDLCDIRNWTTGVSISGIAQWMTTAIEIREGVSGVSINGMSSKSSYPSPSYNATTGEYDFGGGQPPNPWYSVRLHDSNNTLAPMYFQNINISTGNQWQGSLHPVDWYTSRYMHAFSYDGWGGSTSTVAPAVAYSTYRMGQRILSLINPAYHWVCSLPGTRGTLNANNTKATAIWEPGTNTTQVIKLTSSRGAFPGMITTLKLDDNSTRTVSVSTCNAGTLYCGVYPPINGTMTNGTIRYRTPLFKLTGHDNNIQYTTYAANATIRPDLSLGGTLVVSDALSGNATLANPTNGLEGQRFAVMMRAGAAAHAVKFGTWYKMGNATSLTIPANNGTTLDFIIGANGAGGIRLLGVPKAQPRTLTLQ